MKRANRILTFSTAVGVGLIAASAYAQQSAVPTPASAPAQATTTQAAPPAPAAPRGPSKEDRAAFFDAHVAAVHAGLRLTPDQERLWGPVESAVRDMARQMSDLRDRQQAQAAPADPIERMARMGDMASKRGQAMTRVAEAARPLYASLSDDQKRRLRVLIRARGPDGMGMGMGMGEQMGRGDEGRRHGHHRYGMADGIMGHAPGMHGEDMRGAGRGMRRGDTPEGGRWNDWR